MPLTCALEKEEPETKLQLLSMLVVGISRPGAMSVVCIGACSVVCMDGIFLSATENTLGCNAGKPPLLVRGSNAATILMSFNTAASIS